jgi:hypothetical protein
LQSSDRAHRLLGVVEVETAESVNNLEAMSQWASFARLRAPFHLYVPAGSIDSARRLCTDLQIPVAEIWAFHPLGDQLRFTLMHRGLRADGKELQTGASLRTASATRGTRSERRSPSRATAARSNRRPAPTRRKPGTMATRSSSGKAKTSRTERTKKRASTQSRAQKRK